MPRQLTASRVHIGSVIEASAWHHSRACESADEWDTFPERACLPATGVGMNLPLLCACCMPCHIDARSVLEFEALTTRCVDGSASVAASLLLVLLLGEALAARDRQVLVGFVGILIALVVVAHVAMNTFGG
jgi:hypothetical protein